jgi:hypothetical protein
LTSEKKIAANRANAKKSTGPKTLRGRARAAQNARRHGLSISIFADPILSAEAENLATEIIGEGVNPDAIELARRIAEAQIDLVRIGQARYEILKSVAAVLSLQKSIGEGSSASGEVLQSYLEELVALDRYERRTLSRRKFAIREFDAVSRPIIAP